MNDRHKGLTGPEATMAWSKNTYKANHLPGWFTTQVRLRAKLEGQVNEGYFHPYTHILNCEHKRIWDKVGSIQLTHFYVRCVITQPYCDDVKAAQDFANKYCVKLMTGPSGVWQSGSSMFLFIPKKFEFTPQQSWDVKQP